jgi:hypothetical protein
MSVRNIVQKLSFVDKYSASNVNLQVMCNE